jgi:hypothetical protein
MAVRFEWSFSRRVRVIEQQFDRLRGRRQAEFSHTRPQLGIHRSAVGGRRHAGFSQPRKRRQARKYPWAVRQNPAAQAAAV